MTKKKTSKSIPLPILILIYAVLLFAMYLSLSTLALAIWGERIRKEFCMGILGKGHIVIVFESIFFLTI